MRDCMYLNFTAHVRLQNVLEWNERAREGDLLFPLLLEDQNFREFRPRAQSHMYFLRRSDRTGPLSLSQFGSRFSENLALKLVSFERAPF
jgi:hypothetical protein